ncbi:ferredoxin reductase domain-containing protein [Amycolatopsis thailandensis]|uniref:hypothetical protein n=1 Tax=Amycolatopsis thailandensis TaxID=589330 RepID=UPI00362C1798
MTAREPEQRRSADLAVPNCEHPTVVIRSLSDGNPEAIPGLRVSGLLPVPAQRGPGRHRKPELPAASLPPATRWQRFAKRPLFFHYNRLIAITIVVNVAVAFAGVGVELATNAVLVNLTVAVLIRYRHVLNGLFEAVRHIPRGWPLWLRRSASKVYHVGGIHVGASISGTIWYIVLVACLISDAAADPALLHSKSYCLAYAVAALLVTICVLALPVVRRRRHNLFERSHRYAGWLVLGLFWTQALLIEAEDQSGVFSWDTLLGKPHPWLLLGISICILLPWKNLRRVKVSVESPSPHVAIVDFDCRWAPFNSSSAVVSLSPLGEWHAFAAIDPPAGRRGYRVVMARAGDWTARFIDRPPDHVWIKTGSISALGRITGIFERVLFVATGSGIGPILTSMIGRVKTTPHLPTALLWVARSPRKTFGDKLVDEVLELVPGAQIIDTAIEGKPDMIELTYQVAVGFGADAVFCTSNRKVTLDLVRALESRGIPTNGALFDS